MKKRFFIESIIILLFSLISLVYYFSKGNFEFVIYVFIIWAIFFPIVYSDKWFHYPKIAIWGLMIWVFLHMAGGWIYIGATRLYDLILIPLVGEPFHILKYDQALHLFTYAVLALLIYTVAKKYFKKQNAVTAIIVILTALGLSALYEILEFATVITLTSTGVGGYYNLMLDLVFNLFGAIIGVLIGRKIYKK